ncbi:MAG: hypothetical protein ABI599_13860 [Flavobacteriales bacterium]
MKKFLLRCRDLVNDAGRLAFPGPTDLGPNQQFVFLVCVVLFFGAVFYFVGDRI